MSEKVTPYKNSQLSKKEQVATMFNTISGNYDSLNRVISFGIDIKWRKKLLDLIYLLECWRLEFRKLQTKSFLIVSK